MKKLALLPILGLAFLAQTPTANAIKVGDTAPCVVLNQIAPNGSESEHCIRDTATEGEAKVIEFFSATCSDCAKNLPIVSALAMRLEGKATTRFVGIDRSESLLRNYVQQNRAMIHSEVALDTNRDAKRAYDVIETPTLFVLDHENKVIFRHSGVLSAADVETIENLVDTQR